MDKSRVLSFGTALTVVLCLFAAFAFGDARANKTTKTITGVVKRAEVYGEKLRSVYIEDPQQGDFLVVRGTEVGKQLLKYVGVEITATGYVRKSLRDPEFELVLDVLSYEIAPLNESKPTLTEAPLQDR